MKKMNLTGPPVSLDQSVRDSQAIINDRKYIKKGNGGPNTKHNCQFKEGQILGFIQPFTFSCFNQEMFAFKLCQMAL